jgi:hypothetical protein
LTLNQRPTLLVALLLIALAGVLFFGLRPKDYDFSNKVSLIEGNRGLQFEKYSIAYTLPFDIGTTRRLDSPVGFTLFLNFQPRPDFEDGFGLILVMHTGDYVDQLMVGQYRNHIVAMNGDDYAHKRKKPRVVFDITELQSPRFLLTLTSGGKGTRIFANGMLVKEKADLTLNIPAKEATRLMLANSPYGQAFWKGEIYGLALYDHEISAGEMITRFELWKAEKPLSSANMSYPLILYDFENIEGNLVKDLSGNGVNLVIPNTAEPIQKKILSVQRNDFKLNMPFFLDVGLNFLGFVPLGFLFMMALPLESRSALLVTVLTCFLLSAGMEVAQAWMPSRSSSMFDLLMNSSGALSGAFLSDRI